MEEAVENYPNIQCYMHPSHVPCRTEALLFFFKSLISSLNIMKVIYLNKI